MKSIIQDGNQKQIILAHVWCLNLSFDAVWEPKMVAIKDLVLQIRFLKYMYDQKPLDYIQGRITVL